MAETFRVLKPGCVHRVTTPNLHWVLKNRCTLGKGIEGVSDEPWEKWQHKDMLSPGYISELAGAMGYQIKFQKRGKSLAKELPKEYRPDPKQPYAEDSHIFVDLIKPEKEITRPLYIQPDCTEKILKYMLI